MWPRAFAATLVLAALSGALILAREGADAAMTRVWTLSHLAASVAATLLLGRALLSASPQKAAPPWFSPRSWRFAVPWFSLVTAGLVGGRWAGGAETLEAAAWGANGTRRRSGGILVRGEGAHKRRSAAWLIGVNNR